MSRQSIGIANEAPTLPDRVVTLPTGTQTLDPATHANRLLLLSTADAPYTINLPKTKGSGDVYEFLSTVARTSGSVIINATHDGTSNVFVGTVKNHTSAATVATFSSTANDIITLNITTTGGQRAGDRLKIVDAAVGTWRIVDFDVYSSGAQATPFSG